MWCLLCAHLVGSEQVTNEIEIASLCTIKNRRNEFIYNVEHFILLRSKCDADEANYNLSIFFFSVVLTHCCRFYCEDVIWIITIDKNVLGSEFVFGKYWQSVEQRGSDAERAARRWRHTAGLQRSEQKSDTIVSCCRASMHEPFFSFFFFFPPSLPLANAVYIEQKL